MALTIAMAAMLQSCRTTKPVVMMGYSDRAIHDTVLRVDSVWRDRIHIVYMQGDTTYIHDSIYLYKYAYRDRDREVYIHDSIPYPVEVVREVHKRSSYDRFTSWFFWISIAIMIICLAFFVADKIPACKPYTAIIKALFRIR